MNHFLVILLGYLVGSIPFAFLLARRHGVDLRRVGSGNVGATNVLRSTGVPLAVLAMVLDAVKGSLAVFVAQRVAAGYTVPVAAGLAAILGHLYPVWLGFRGGKGVATAAGVFVVLAPAALGIASVVFLLMVVATRYISLGSLAGAIALPIASFTSGLNTTVAVGATVAALIIVHRHRGNLSRLFAGTERRVGQRL